MNICDINNAAGVNINCLKYPARISNVLFVDSNVKFTSISDFENLNTWKTKIKQNLSVYVPAGLANSEDTTGDPNRVTTALGQKFVSGAESPSAVVYLQSNPCDYNEILSKFAGGNYGIFLVLEDGSLVGWVKSDTGEVYPFTANVYSTPSKLHDPGAPEASYRVWINYQSLDQHKARVFRKPVWNPMLMLPTAMPNGISLIQTSTVTAGDVTVSASVRCGDAVTGLTVSDFEIRSSNNSELEISAAVDNNDGSYTLTIDDGAGGTPTPIAAGEYVVIRVKKSTGGNVTDVSGDLTIQA